VAAGPAAENRAVIIDADGHILENQREIHHYLEPPYNRKVVLGYPLFPTLDGFHRGAILARIGVHEVEGTDAATWSDVLDKAGIDWTVLYPSAGLCMGLVRDAKWAVTLARAYNNWFSDTYTKKDRRLRGVALLPLHDPDAAAQELRRCVTELGMMGGLLPAAGFPKPLGHPSIWPIYEEASRLDCMIGVHGAVGQNLGLDLFDDFSMMATLHHPFAQMIQMTSLVLGGVVDRFKNLRIAFLEAGAGWAPFMSERMTRAYKVWRMGGALGGKLQLEPPEVLKSGRVFFSIEPDETTIPYVAATIGEDALLFTSDFPHENGVEEVRHDIEEFRQHNGLSQGLKTKILSENALRLYGKHALFA
jgi:uncharacterized protein